MKTPAPNRQALRTPAPQRLAGPSPLPLPSAQRTRRRSRSSLSSQTSHHTPDQSYATPGPAHRWEEELSLDSIVEAEVEVAAETGDNSDYELEYAPPKAKEIPWAPLWVDDVPDPVESLKVIAGMRPLFFRDPPSPPTELAAVEHPHLSLCSDDELEHPLFRRSKSRVAIPSAVKPSRPGLGPRVGLSSRPPLVSRSASNVRTSAIAQDEARKPTRPVSVATKPAPKPLSTRPAITSGPARPPRPATTMSRAPAAPLRVASARPPTMSRTGTAAAKSIRGQAALPKPIPVLESLALPDMEEVTLDLDLDILGPDPAAVNIEQVSPQPVEEKSAVDVMIEAVSGQAEDIIVASEPAAVMVGSEAKHDSVTSHPVDNMPTVEEATPTAVASIPEGATVPAEECHLPQNETETPTPQVPDTHLGPPTVPIIPFVVIEDVDELAGIASNPIPGATVDSPPLVEPTVAHDTAEIPAPSQIPATSNSECSEDAIWTEADKSFTDDILAAAMAKSLNLHDYED